MEQSQPGDKEDLSNICSVLQILGAKWAFLVIAELSKGPRRFNQLSRDLAVVKTQSLSNALRHLEHSGIVSRRVFPTVPVTVEYSLTEKGMDFKTALLEMERWAARWNLEEQPREQDRIQA
ncbi:winged helix-turn-helix transcriptional regulator [Paenibacillus chibensis]|uniref:winged helix-turn-helix transcriptional regulator n=1 Tax=Paenibacillus chibensis TaxID=59846 RepID=UPI000FDB1787|nr:helix-turn-helix domain-containing protein [Paenibacillus chibensis]MEC0368422.1 helix-turn-helix domain-containing protein [Paenibacillus chibensis]